MTDTAERLLKRKTRIAEAMHGDNYIPETLDAGEQAIAMEITEILKRLDEISEGLSRIVRGL
jgi:hypothetical protein